MATAMSGLFVVIAVSAATSSEALLGERLSYRVALIPLVVLLIRAARMATVVVDCKRFQARGLLLTRSAALHDIRRLTSASDLSGCTTAATW